MLLTQPTFVITILCGILLLLASWKIFLLSRENKLLARQLTETSQCLELTRRDLRQAENNHKKFNDLSKQINTPDLTTELQSPRIKHQSSHNISPAPEKYSYIHLLIEKGMSEEDIASLLSISLHETRQLVNLSRIASPS